MKLDGYKIVCEAASSPALTPEDFQQLRRAQELGAVKGATVGALGGAAIGAIVAGLLTKGVPRPEAHKLIKLVGGISALAGLSYGAAIGTLLKRWKFVGKGYEFRNRQKLAKKEIG